MQWLKVLVLWVALHFFLAGELRAQDYKNGISAINWNHTDSLGRKNGPWREYATGEPFYCEYTYFNDTLHGPYQRYSPTGRLVEQGNYAYGDKNGRVLRFGENGKVAEEGCYDEGLKTGIWRTYHPNGKIRTECTYVAGELEGTYTEYSEKGELIATIPFHEGQREGRAMVQFIGTKQKASQYFQKGRLTLSAIRDDKGKIIEVTKVANEGQEALYLSKE
jgi:antitoxin component YwqK of YwqJK toxin-antitoxin module